jgi:hypothetical protein
MLNMWPMRAIANLQSAGGSMFILSHAHAHVRRRASCSITRALALCSLAVRRCPAQRSAGHYRSTLPLGSLTSVRVESVDPPNRKRGGAQPARGAAGAHGRPLTSHDAQPRGLPPSSAARGGRALASLHSHASRSSVRRLSILAHRVCLSRARRATSTRAAHRLARANPPADPCGDLRSNLGAQGST